MHIRTSHKSSIGLSDTCMIAGRVVGCCSMLSVPICSSVCDSVFADSSLVKRESLVVCCTDRRVPAIWYSRSLGRGLGLLPGQCCKAASWMLWLCAGCLLGSIADGAKSWAPTVIVILTKWLASSAYSAAKLQSMAVSTLVNTTGTSGT